MVSPKNQQFFIPPISQLRNVYMGLLFVVFMAFNGSSAMAQTVQITPPDNTNALIRICGLGVLPHDLHAVGMNRGFPDVTYFCSGSGVTITADQFNAELPSPWDGSPISVPMMNGVFLSYSDVVSIHPNLCGPNQQMYRITRTFLVNDGCGSTATASHLINVGDNQAPVAVVTSAPVVISLSQACEASVSVGDIDGGSTDNCGDDPLNPNVYSFEDNLLIRVISPYTSAYARNIALQIPTAQGELCNLTFTIELLATDQCGNTHTATKVISVVDDLAPEVTAPADVAQIEGCSTDDISNGGLVRFPYSEVETVVPVGEFGDEGGLISERCSPNDLTISYIDTVTIDCGFAIRRTWRAEDFCGNIGIAVQNIFISNTTAPSILGCTSTVAFECGPDVQTDVQNWVSGQLADVLSASFSACGDALTGTTDFSGTLPDFACAGTSFEVVFTVADTCGLSSSCTTTISIVDTEDPTVRCPEPVNREICTLDDLGPGLLPYQSALTSISFSEFQGAGGTAADNCSGTDLNAFYVDVLQTDEPMLKSVLRTFVVTDSCGNSASCTQILTLTSVVGPSVICPTDTIIGTDLGECSGIFDFGVPYSDNCSGTSYQGFVGPFAPANWTLTQTPSGAAAVDLERAPTQVTLRGDNGPNTTNSVTTLCVTIPGTQTGSLSFMYTYRSFAVGGPSVDPFGYSLDGVFTQVSNDAGPNLQVGVFTIAVSPGQTFCFELRTGVDASGPIVTLGMNFDFMEGSGLVLSQISGLPSGSQFPLGTTINTLLVTDNNNNTASCSFTVTVEDRESPEIFCPSNVLIQLPPRTCDTAYVLPIPTASDNCTLNPVILQTGGIPSGFDFPIGSHTVIFTAADQAQNTSTCSFVVSVADYVNTNNACQPINLSLDQACTGVVSPLQVLADTVIGCLDRFVVTVFDKNNLPIGNTLDGSYLGQTLTYTVENESIGFFCHSTVLVEDKFAPSIICQNDTLSCLASVDLAVRPLPVDNCSATAVLESRVFDPVDCDPAILGRTTERWYALDAYGNRSATCTRTVAFRRTNLVSLSFPANIKLACNTFPLDAQGNPQPSATGTPTLNGVSVFPFSPTQICNGYAVYRDEIFVNTDCVKRIQRTWEVGEWWCSQVNNRTFVQIIDVKDETAPVITGLSDITVSTAGQSCAAVVDLPAATLTDNCNPRFTTSVSTGSGVLSTNGGRITLPVGTNVVTYFVTDGCGNQATATIRVTVVDQANPIAVCERNTTVSITASGTAVLPATSLDDGSFDVCGPVTFLTLKMDDGFGTPGAPWAESLTFDCEDVGSTIMVALEVTDLSGNKNTCMVNVHVQDQIPARMNCLPNMTVECTTTFDPTNLGPAFGTVTIVDNCPSNTTLEDVIVGERDQCGEGVLTRTLRLFEGTRLVQTCQQTITFVRTNPFTENDITWPTRTLTFTNDMCDMLDLAPENLPAGAQRPILNRTLCDLAAASHRDTIIPATNNNACFLVIRTWTVIDWCRRNGAGEFERYTFQQTFVVNNTIAPTITSSNAARFVCSYSQTCSSVPITLDASATDDCTPTNELSWTWRIDVNKAGTQFLSGTGRDASGTYPVGVHRIEFVVQDRCGNATSTAYDFEIRNCTPPVAYCIDGMSVDLVGVDTDQDGLVDAEQVSIIPDSLDADSYHVCGIPVTLSFSADPNDQVRTFGCDDIGNNLIDLWAIDANGNTSICRINVVVTDNNNVDICDGPRPGRISGTISNVDQIPVEGVDVTLISNESRTLRTPDSGAFAFENLTLQNPYEVAPSKNDDANNGVSTLDIVQMQRHILGIESFTTPAQYIAADVNKSKTITSADVVEVRKIVLGTQTQFSKNESWRFVDRNFEFETSNPLALSFPEICAIPALQGDMVMDFLAIKVGDVNGSATPNLTNSVTNTRSVATHWTYQFDGDYHGYTKVAIKAADVRTLFGFQAELKSEYPILQVLPAELGLQNDQMVIKGNSLKIAYHHAEGVTTGEDAVLFYLVLDLDSQLGVLPNIKVENGPLPAEIYVSESLEVQDLQIRSAATNAQGPSLTVGQNQPNPWTMETRIPFETSKAGLVKLTIYDVKGSVVLQRSSWFEAGNQNFRIDRSSISSAGIHFYEIQSENQIETRKMIVLE